MSRLGKIRDKLPEHGLDAVMLTSAPNRLYATGFHSSAGIALVTRERAFFFTDSRYFEAAKASICGADVGLIERGRKYTDLINGVIAACDIEKLGFEDVIMSVAEYSAFKAALKAELVPAQETLSGLRSSKDGDELAHMAKAQQITDDAFDEILGKISTDMTERGLAAELVYCMLKRGAERVSFEPIVVSGANSSLPHGMPGMDKLQKGSFVTMDFGCVYNGYCSDMTRTVAIGGASEQMRRVYYTVLDAQTAGIAAARAGVPGSEVDRAARDVITRAGYGEYFGHGFGHGVGIEVHEEPTASPSAQEALPEFAVISAEPGIYLPGQFGARIEDVIVIGRDGCANLTRSPKELIVL